MFTGIIERLGVVSSVTQTDSGYRLEISSEGLDRLPEGASIAVNGVCLTAIDPEPGSVSVDVVPETLARTSLRSVEQGSQLNLELAMPAGGRFDGHIVQGHVDGTGTIADLDTSVEGAVTMTISLPTRLARYVVEKGSITVDGVSLTVMGATEDSFSVALIPHTLAVTTLGLRKVGDPVNLEVDVLAKYVERMLKAQQ